MSDIKTLSDFLSLEDYKKIRDIIDDAIKASEFKDSLMITIGGALFIYGIVLLLEAGVREKFLFEVLGVVSEKEGPEVLN